MSNRSRVNEIRSRALATVLTAASLIANATAVRAGELSADEARARAREEIRAIWDDPTFQKRFVGAYGIDADVEPRISPDDVKLLEKIRPLMADNLPAARAALLKALKPESSAILDYTLAGIHFQQDELPAALAAYERAVGKFPSFRRAWRNVGLIHARNGEFDAAIRGFTRFIELGGGDAYSYGLLGFAYASKQDYQAAEAAYRNALLLQPENTEWRLGLTRCVFKQEKFQDAAALLDVLIERYPDKAEFWLLQAQTYLGMKQPLAAAENIEALELLGKATAENLHTLGEIYAGEQLMDLAQRAFVRAIHADANQPVARPLRAAELLAARGALRQARFVASHVRTALAPNLGDDDKRKVLKLEARLSMADGTGNAETAAVLAEIVQLDPLDGEALMLLAQHHTRQNQPDQAIFFYERAASLADFEAVAKTRHAQVLAGLGRYADALPLLRRAQELKPREDVARYLEQVERIAKSRR